MQLSLVIYAVLGLQTQHTHALHVSARFGSRPLGRHASSRARPVAMFDSNELVVAARRGNVAAIERLLADGARVNDGVPCAKIGDMDGATALIWAARQGFFDSVELLLRADAEVNSRTRSGWTALYVAALNGHSEVVDRLLAQGADVEAALNVGDERTNLNLERMVAAFQANPTAAAPPAVAATPPSAAAAPAPPPEWRASSLTAADTV